MTTGSSGSHLPCLQVEMIASNGSATESISHQAITVSVIA
jgi:hypothetical protein